MLRIMSITIVDYDAGNLKSVARACAAVGLAPSLARTPEQVLQAERLIFPGVGNAQSAMETLIERGLHEALREVFKRGTPMLGICVGAQLILDRSEESTIPCLGLIPGVARKFVLPAPLKVPHIGWNEVRPKVNHPLLANLRPGDEFYFVHSYFPAPVHRVPRHGNHGLWRRVLLRRGSRQSVRDAVSPGEKRAVGTRSVAALQYLGRRGEQKDNIMLSKRVVVCLDVRDGKLAKSVKFVDTKDIGDPVEKAAQYYNDGLDELVFYDITASSDRRGIMLDVVSKVAECVFIPFSVGGGIRSVADASALRYSGAEKINVNSAAIRTP